MLTGLIIIQITGKWSGETAGGCPNHPTTYKNNPMYQIRLDADLHCLRLELKAPKDVQVWRSFRSDSDLFQKSLQNIRCISCDTLLFRYGGVLEFTHIFTEIISKYTLYLMSHSFDIVIYYRLDVKLFVLKPRTHKQVDISPGSSQELTGTVQCGTHHKKNVYTS